MTKDAELFLTPSFDKGAGTADAAAKNGIAAIVADDEQAAAAEVRKLINLLPVNNMAMAPCMEYDVPSAAAGSDLASYVDSIADAGSVVEVYADYADAAYTALATVNEEVSGKLRPLAERIDAFRNNPSSTLGETDFNALKSDIATMKAALQDIRKNGVQVGNGRMMVAKDIMKALEFAHEAIDDQRCDVDD